MITSDSEKSCTGASACSTTLYLYGCVLPAQDNGTQQAADLLSDAVLAPTCHAAFALACTWVHLTRHPDKRARAGCSLYPCDIGWGCWFAVYWGFAIILGMTGSNNSTDRPPWAIWTSLAFAIVMMLVFLVSAVLSCGMAQAMEVQTMPVATAQANSKMRAPPAQQVGVLAATVGVECEAVNFGNALNLHPQHSECEVRRASLIS